MSRTAKSKKLKPLGDLLPKVFDKLGFTNRLLQEQVISLWPNVVGDQIAKNTKPVKVEGQTLIVVASNPIWCNELKYLKPEIIKKLNALIGKTVIKNIKFRMR